MELSFEKSCLTYSGLSSCQRIYSQFCAHLKRAKNSDNDFEHAQNLANNLRI